MGNFARYSPDGKTAAADIVTDCIAKCGDVNTKLTTFATDAKTESATWPGKYVKTSSVEYGGDPIKDGDEEKIFERFYKVDSSRNRDSNNYGLGLAIAKNIVTKHNGTIEAFSNKGFTTFRVTWNQK